MADKPTKSSRKKKGAKSRWRVWLRYVFVGAIFMVALPFILIPLYSFIPPISTLMVKDLVMLKGYQRNWVDYDEISRRAIHSVMMSEDARHCVHGGVDWVEMQKAWNSITKGGRGRGASTITMQTVKNLFLWNSRSYVRKVIELPLALYADFWWSKRRTIEIYLNIAEWDGGVYGIDAAARHYFKIPAAQLNRTQSALLAVALPSPIKRNPAKPSQRVKRLSNVIVKRTNGAGPYIGCLAS